MKWSCSDLGVKVLVKIKKVLLGKEVAFIFGLLGALAAIGYFGDTFKAEPLYFDLNYTYHSPNQDDSYPLREESILHSGDYYKLYFTPALDSYVYLFQKDSSNRLFELFPMTRFKGKKVNNPNPAVKGKQNYHIPTERDSFKLDDQTGKEQLYFYATKVADTQLEKLLVQYRYDTDDAQVAPEPILAYLNSKDSASVLSHFNGITRLQVCQRGCVYVITFEHR